MQSKNQLVIASAGSGKTTMLVEQAGEKRHGRVLIVTYTQNNYEEIRKKLFSKYGAIPNHVTVQTWFTFLLRECVRPYQNVLYDLKRVESVFFPTDLKDFNSGRRFIKKDNIPAYYFVNKDKIIADNMSDFVIGCNEAAGGLIIDRLEKLYDSIFIDEVQDLAGWDLEIVCLLFRSNINTLLVGDPRQYIYSTNNSKKNSQFRGTAIVEFFKSIEKKGMCRIRYEAVSHRCNQMICSFADSLYPDMPQTKSLNKTVSGHDGLFAIGSNMFDQYMERFTPIILRYDRRTKCANFEALNFGESKGMTFDRVLILPHKCIQNYLKTGDIQHVEGSLAKFYVAITRARYSVAFLYDGPVKNNFIKPYLCA
jgi:DNA helicase-2/ATP-dependent DNA helicase PcrA